MYKILKFYPEELTNKSWQKKKSFMDKAKAKTKTGLGAELEKLQAEWDRINWDALDATTAMSKVDQSAKYRGPKEFDFAKAVGESEIKGQVALVRKLVMNASRTARDTSKNTDLSKDALKKAQEISAGLLKLETGLREITLDDFDEKKKRFLELFQMQMKGLKKAVLELEAGLTEVAKSPTKVTWNDKVKQKFRSVGNTLGNFEQFKDDWKVWVKFDGLQADNDPQLKKGADPGTEKQVILGLVKEALPHLQNLKKKVAQM